MSIEYLDFHFPKLSHVHCVFTTRYGGVSTGPFTSANLSLEVGDEPQNVYTNRKSLHEQLGFAVWQELRQVHGQTVFVDLQEDFFRDPILKGDGLFTRYCDHGLVIKTADCQALMFTDRKGQYVGALHCGWRGNAANFPGQGVRSFCDHYGLGPEEIMVVRGPSLGPEKSEFVNFHQEWTPDFSNFFNAMTRTMDLWCLTRHQLMEAGVLSCNNFSLDLCTASLDQFFSYRQEGVTGRQVGVIWMK